jgi:DNA-directed RNA polymerase subunit N (RpoN/RPB10)
MSCSAPNRGAFYERRSSSGSLAKLAAIRRALSRVSRLVAERRCDAAIYPQVSDKRKSLTHARNDLNDPFDTAGQYCCRRAIIFTVFNVITTSSA